MEDHRSDMSLQMFSGSLCKAGRSLVEFTRAKLALNSGVPEDVILQFERGIDTPDDATKEALKLCLEAFGAVFIPEEGADGAGVRLKFSRSVTDRLRDLVNEGGPFAEDAVP